MQLFFLRGEASFLEAVSSHRAVMAEGLSNEEQINRNVNGNAA